VPSELDSQNLRGLEIVYLFHQSHDLIEWPALNFVLLVYVLSHFMPILGHGGKRQTNALAIDLDLKL
jgi:hypothetical protein